MNKNHILGREEAEELGIKLSLRRQQRWGGRWSVLVIVGQ